MHTRDPNILTALAEALGWPRNARLSNSNVFRSGRRGSLSLNLERGVWHDFESGVGGGIFDLVIHSGEAQTRAEAVRWLRRHGQVLADCRHEPAACARGSNTTARNCLEYETQRQKACALWKEACPIHATLAEQYLRARAIRGPWPTTLQFLPRAWSSEARALMPALIASVTLLEAPQIISGVHRIFLVPPGRKAALNSPKLSLGPTGGGGVILGEIGEAIIIAEGIESALSASRAFGLPAVATLGTGNLSRLTIPQRVRRVVIAPDRDQGRVGERAANALATRLWAEGRVVEIADPPDGCGDWNDWAMMKEAADAS
jgi:hypothetical protein